MLRQEGTRKEKFIPLRTYKPRTPGLRHLKRPVNDHLWKGRPHLKLTIARKGQHLGGRNNTGRVTVRHRGGGHKRRIRIVDYKRYLPGKHVVDRIEYDPNRSSHLALITRVATGEKSYIIAADGMRAGDEVESYRTGIPKELIASMGGGIDPGMLAAKTAARGNCLPIHMVPLGSQVYNVGTKTQGGGVFCRSAGTYAIIVNKEEVDKGNSTQISHVIIRLMSGEIRKVAADACCTIGVASNPQSHFTSLGKAGRSRWLGKRPEVRGLAMNAGQSLHESSSNPQSSNLPQLIIPTVVVVVNPRVMCIPSVPGVLQQREVTRRGTRGTSIPSSSKTDPVIKESGGQSRVAAGVLYAHDRAVLYLVVACRISTIIMHQYSPISAPFMFAVKVSQNELVFSTSPQLVRLPRSLHPTHRHCQYGLCALYHQTRIHAQAIRFVLERCTLMQTPSLTWQRIPQIFLPVASILTLS
jgi:ribosomal protein L2